MKVHDLKSEGFFQQGHITSLSSLEQSVTPALIWRKMQRERERERELSNSTHNLPCTLSGFLFQFLAYNQSSSSVPPRDRDQGQSFHDNYEWKGQPHGRGGGCTHQYGTLKLPHGVE